MSDRKLLGCCTKCDAPIFEMVSRYTEGPRTGEIRRVGRPLPGIRRLTVTRVSGHQSNWSLCKDCEVGAEDMAVLNKKELHEMALERDEAPDAESYGLRDRMLRLFRFDIPLGVLCEEPWSEVR